MFAGQDLTDAVQDIYSDLMNNNHNLRIYVQGAENQQLPDGFHSFDSVLDKASSEAIDPSHRAGNDYTDPMAYIYTSGTTGKQSFMKYLHTHDGI